ncbi:GNAT family N-acetyltransferase [Vibrio hippocampi]|uniref:N-acetyltransferase domain-containing protein n=1 Tax=Vibrio hippocampi TaxID=654686 RepID=A0ABM8ZGN1_9VIBR|nr:GNAT family N-acetyltransferase [Vibrio hippocampi]CAH0525778.1 hypothetical protein VHP8226_01309 [Vibrio hippocampi]
MQYRIASEADLASIQLLARETIDRCYRSFLGDESVDGYLTSGESDKEVANNLSHCLVAELQGEIVGYGVCKDNFIHILMIRPNIQRKGLGSSFLAHIETSMVSSGHNVLKLETFNTNTQAIRFYEKNGWVIVNQETDTEFGFVRVYLEKHINVACRF